MVSKHQGPGNAVARPLRRDAEANRQHILDAAGRLMAERGLATPLEDIAAAAGVGIGTLYRRFPTRADLVEALFQDRLAAYVADLETAVGTDDGWEGLVWFLSRAAARQIADRALSELIEQDLGPDTIRHLRDRVLPLADTLVEHARASGRLRADFTVGDLALVQHMLAGVGAVTSPVSPTAWRRYLTLLLDGMLARREAPTPAEEPAPTVAQLKHVHDQRPRQGARPRCC
ncbi:MAG TPA: helix-turn-helix domain-containing protein [Acidimicrobiales bacterium]|nr:helix-turn-helix domain-containing protein [Acidimicrobiales bacterium]